jgi:uncharacterized protein (TIGR03437 family)
LFTLICFLAGPRLEATNLLTSGEAVNFGLPSATSPVLFNGQIGYAIYVPPGAQRLTIRYYPLTPSQVMEVYVRRGADVGLNGVGAIVRDYVLTDCERLINTPPPNGDPPPQYGQVCSTEEDRGLHKLVIHPQSNPPLQSGTYYIAFYLISSPSLTDGRIEATVEGGSTTPVRTVARSTFDTDPDGWTVAGPSGSRALWTATGGNPGGFLRSEDLGGSSLLVAPAKFLGNLAALKNPRLEFDFKQIAGPQARFSVELRLTGAGSVFSWQGAPPLPPPDDTPYPPPPSYPPLVNPVPAPPAGPPLERWLHYTALLRGAYWTRISGDAAFASALANVQRLEVVTDLAPGGEAQAIDNFALVAEGDGPPPKVLAGNTSFAAGSDGWGRNFPAAELAGATTGDRDSTFRWVGFEGNPTGYIRLNDAGGPNRDYLVAPERFLGDFRDIPNAQIEFDYYHYSPRGATLPVEVRLVGAGSVFTWTGAIPGQMWTRYAAPLAAAFWQRVSGSADFAAALANVQRIEISMDQADGGEWNGVDNFWVLTASTTPAPAALSANPQALSFSAVARSANPVAQSVGVTAMGGGSALSFTVSSTAPWLRINADNGTTPRALSVWPDVAGLPEGTYTGRIVVTPLGGNLGPQTVAVSLNVSSRPGGIPRISSGGVVNAANGRRQLSPGALGTIYGENFGPAAPEIASFRPNTTILPTRLQGVRVLVQETYGSLIAEAPLLYASRSQINFQLPYECFGRAEVLIVVDNNGALSDPQPVQVISSAPGIFTWGEGRAVAVNQDGSVNSPQNAAPRGSALTVYLTGQGVITPELPSGAAATARPLVRCPLPARAWVGHTTAQLLFVGMAPALVGVLQVNLLVPPDAPTGETQLLFNIDGWTSNFAAVTIR